jgi:excisionase family DNA binding protein
MAMIAEKPAWLTVKEVARRLDLHEITVRRKIHDGVIPALQLGGRGTAIRVLEDEFEAWLFREPPAPRGGTGSTGAAGSPRGGLEGEAA